MLALVLCRGAQVSFQNLNGMLSALQRECKPCSVEASQSIVVSCANWMGKVLREAKLTQLEEMGFCDRACNIYDLVRNNGNVSSDLLVFWQA
jgi:hypothetical protein